MAWLLLVFDFVIFVLWFAKLVRHGGHVCFLLILASVCNATCYWFRRRPSLCTAPLHWPVSRTLRCLSVRLWVKLRLTLWRMPSEKVSQSGDAAAALRTSPRSLSHSASGLCLFRFSYRVLAAWVCQWLFIIKICRFVERSIAIEVLDCITLDC